MWRVTLDHGIFLPQIGWHLDAPKPVARSFISHAHSDHVANHKVAICTPATARLFQARTRSKSKLREIPFGETVLLGTTSLDAETRVTLLPAGHIFGSAQWLAENEHGRLLYTGDFKLAQGLSAETCATPRADTLIMETTFGVPRYAFPPQAEVLAALRQFCHQSIAEGAVPILLGYSLGKSQELLRALDGVGLPIMLHPQSLEMTRVYEMLGMQFPHYKPLDTDSAAGHVIICPPQAAQSEWIERINPRRTATITGWAIDTSTRYRSRVDAAFALSDHADFKDLLRFVDLVQPKVVYTVHGFAQEFAQTLRHRGIEAWALGRENQLELSMGM
ncbi:MAG: MBL fold metallo-hydrolase [Verrucomicrobiota bacterium]|nr:MBL fold metallo-hydrolase [Verrucomicrobiota bacterium]